MDTDKHMKIGMVGLGLMGHGIAKNLLKHGYPMLLFEHPGNQPIDDLLSAGAETSKDLAALAAAVGTIMLCVTGTPEVEQVLLRPGGLLAGMKPGTTIIDCWALSVERSGASRYGIWRSMVPKASCVWCVKHAEVIYLEV